MLLRLLLLLRLCYCCCYYYYFPFPLFSVSAVGLVVRQRQRPTGEREESESESERERKRERSNRAKRFVSRRPAIASQKTNLSRQKICESNADSSRLVQDGKISIGPGTVIHPNVTIKGAPPDARHTRRIHGWV